MHFFNRPLLNRKFTILGVVTAVAVAAAALLLRPDSESRRAAADTQAADGAQQVARLIRISATQYRQAIRDVFGTAIDLNVPLVDAHSRSGGLLAVGDSQVSVTSAGFDAATNAARKIAGQIVAEGNRAILIGCAPAATDAPDDACASQFFARTGRFLYRRALSDAELTELVRLTNVAATELNDFYAAMASTLATMLTSPDFMFRIEVAEPDPDAEGQYRLTGYSKGARLAALLWNSNPDEDLLSAAERGDLDSKRGLAAQIDRMMASPKAENGVRAFFSDLLEFDKFDSLGKDPAIYPRFTSGIGAEIEEQALRVLVDQLLVKTADYRELFHTRETFLTPALAAMLDIPLPPQGAENGEPDRWVRYQYEAGDPRAGFLVLPAFTALHSHPGKSSPTLRGKAVRETLLCQTVPPPPANVDFQLFNSGNAGATARERLEVHNTVPACAGCHKIMDPLGFALEHFDGTGRWRADENGHPIDTTGELDGVGFKDAPSLAETVSENPKAVSCLVNRIYSYGTGRALTAKDRGTTDRFRKEFEESGYRLPALLKVVATSPDFYRIDASQPQLSQARGDESAVLAQTGRGETQ